MNWLADPVACARWLRTEKGCNVVESREAAVLSRSTRAIRTQESDGVRWSWGHLYAERRKDAKGRAVIVGGSHGANPHHTTETAAMSPEHANVLSDLLRAAYVNAGGNACGGQTILELLWQELDAIMERLMTDQEAEDDRDPGRAEGVAYCIAVMQNPYLPNIDAVREQAMERWEASVAETTQVAPIRTRADMRRARRSRRG